jgi:short-subunit dehydrogenase
VTARRTALITGASAGIGEAFARVFAAHGFDLVLTARREDRLRALATALEHQHGVRAHVLSADLAEPAAPARLCQQLATANLAIDALVNNAGYGVPGSFTSVAWQRHVDFLQVLLMSVTELTYRLLPGMVERGYGRIINVASLAGLLPSPAGHTLYGATKSFLIRFSEALSCEVAERGVHVTAVCPGFTLSEFHDVTGTRQMMRGLPSWAWMDAQTVAQQGYDAVMAGRPVYITGRVNTVIALLARYLPHRLVHALNRRMGRSYRKT